jgi:hypothetical protein
MMEGVNLIEVHYVTVKPSVQLKYANKNAAKEVMENRLI